MAVRFTSRLVREWTPQEKRRLDIELLDLSTKIHRKAGDYAPYLTGALYGSGRIKRVNGGHYQVIFGGGAIKYGYIRHEVNYRNPHTRKYLKRGGDEESKLFLNQLKRTYR